MTDLEAENAMLRQRLAAVEASAKAALSGSLAAHARIDELDAMIKQLRPRAARHETVEIVE